MARVLVDSATSSGENGVVHGGTQTDEHFLSLLVKTRVEGDHAFEELNRAAWEHTIDTGYEGVKANLMTSRVVLGCYMSVLGILGLAGVCEASGAGSLIAREDLVNIGSCR